MYKLGSEVRPIVRAFAHSHINDDSSRLHHYALTCRLIYTVSDSTHLLEPQLIGPDIGT